MIPFVFQYFTKKKLWNFSQNFDVWQALLGVKGLKGKQKKKIQSTKKGGGKKVCDNFLYPNYMYRAGFLLD